jgi:5-methylthioribose kinase
MTRAEFAAKHPEFPLLAAGDVAGTEAVLRRVGGVLAAGERVEAVTKAGEGNMNLTLRVGISGPAGGRSVIVKQSRPWVEKYDFIAAPWDRAVMEAAFYRAVRDIPAVAGGMPMFIRADTATRTLALEDLGATSDLFPMYSGGAGLSEAEVAGLMAWLSALHGATRGKFDPALRNEEMRRLNHAYIFDLPLQTPAEKLVEIGPGLDTATAKLLADGEYVRAVESAGRLYLSAEGPCLLHGDFFPGSVLRARGGLKVIDPEFCFFGPAEFDVGVWVAHLALAQQPQGLAEAVLAGYRPPLDAGLVGRFAGIEVMRRLIGVAQLPLGAGMDKAGLLLRSHRAVRSGDVGALWE